MSYGGFSLPKGFRFHPSDEELLSHYLQMKNDQREDPEITAIIPEIDVSKHEPRDLPALVFARAEFLDREWFTMADSPDMEWYFFSPRVFKHSNSKSTKINRTTDEGSWKKQGNDRRITGAFSDKQIGGKRILTFYLPNKQKTDWVIHEYYLTKADSDEQIGDFVLCRLKDNRLKKKSGKSEHDPQDAPLCDGREPSSGSCSMAFNVEDQASSELGNVVVIPNGNVDEAEHGGGSCSMTLYVESPASKQLENVLLNPYGNNDDTEHGHIVSGMLTEAEEYQGFKELQDALFESDGNDQGLRGSETAPCYIDKNDLSVSVEGQPDSYNSPDSEMVEELLHEPGDLALLHPPPSIQLQSPIYTKLGTHNIFNDEYRKRKYPFGDSEPFLTKKNHTDEVDSYTSSNSENQPADAIPEGYSQPGGNLGSDLFRSQTLPSINREPRVLSHDNIWDHLPSIIEGFEFSLANFSDTVIDRGISDRNIEGAYGSANDYNALAIGETL
uniref:NAC domain-containing protein 4-like isoform X1 n=1 Tax=Fragaria vesca subsp. vesca TaxID=101020 RepID=UPI0005C89151|nr:PREDICTED: NAC domain-containing protein 4-like isoform X1 [Fragaria vesca subsp. vesca]